VKQLKIEFLTSNLLAIPDISKAFCENLIDETDSLAYMLIQEFIMLLARARRI